MGEPSYEELKARLTELEKQTTGRRSGNLEFRVGEKGGVSVYGLGRFPVTLYYEQWTRLLAVNLHAPVQFTRELLPALLALTWIALLVWLWTAQGFVAGIPLDALTWLGFGLAATRLSTE